MSPLWISVYLGVLLCGFIEESILSGVLGLIFSIANLIVFVIILNIKIAKKYGLSVFFAVGMMFLPYVFYAIIGWGPFVYTGTKKQKRNVNGIFSLNGNENDDYVPKSDFFRD